ncbi:MAG: ABC transporter permease [Planctomycetaceae bacterium]|nr:ABC transporter permease [Planctomycetaceae bacterium]
MTTGADINPEELVGGDDPASQFPTQPDPTLAERPMRYYSARTGWQLVDLAELWEYRDLIWMLSLRDIKVKYRQTIVGVAWAVIQPLITMVVFGVLFQLIKGQPTTGDVPYAVTCLCGLVPWQLFAGTLSQSTSSLVVNQNLVTKVYFPRVALPLSTLVAGLVDFGIAFVILVGTMAALGVVPSAAIALLPLMVMLVLLTSIAFGLWLSSLNALYRDIEYAVPFFIQIGFFVSPVVYEMNAVIPAKWQWLYSLNPMVGVLEGFRWAMLGTESPPVTSVLLSVIGVLFVLISGLVYFRRMERHFADRI